MRTDFAPKYKEGKAIIPYTTHMMWMTLPHKIKVMNYTNIWHMVDQMGLDNKDGNEWKHVFWTNELKSVVLNETACRGRCEVKMLNTLEGYGQVASLIE